MSRNNIQANYSSRRGRCRQRRRRRLKRHYKILIALLLILLLGLILNALFSVFSSEKDLSASMSEGVSVVEEYDISEAPDVTEDPDITEEAAAAYALGNSSSAILLDAEIQSEYAVLVDLDAGTMIAEKNSAAIINPASMTKILTLLVAAENISGTEGTFTMTREIADYCYSNECSVVGYEVGEQIPIIELFYGCILCSGADACLALAELTSGSHDAFVESMNVKVQELGLSETMHFTNCVGIYNENHHCTVKDMALLMKAVIENSFCKEILSTAVYTSEPTDEHPDGQILSNWFLRRIEDQDTGGITVSCGKTGYVPESGNCAVSYGETSTGSGYICVTGNGSSSWQVIYDHVALYQNYCAAA